MAGDRVVRSTPAVRSSIPTARRNAPHSRQDGGMRSYLYQGADSSSIFEHRGETRFDRLESPPPIGRSRLPITVPANTESSFRCRIRPGRVILQFATDLRKFVADFVLSRSLAGSSVNRHGVESIEALRVSRAQKSPTDGDHEIRKSIVICETRIVALSSDAVRTVARSCAVGCDNSYRSALL